MSDSTAATPSRTATPATTSTSPKSSSSSSSSSENASTWGKDGSVNDYSRFEALDDPAEEGPLVESKRSKDRGNEAFKNKDFAEAVKHYTEAISDMPPKRDDKTNPEAKALRVTLFSNRAACQLQLGELEKCVDDADSALKSDKKAAKALFRRAQANEKRGKVEDACRDLYAIVRMDPTNKSAKKAYQRTKKRVHSRSLQAIVDAYNANEAKEAKDARDKAEKKRMEAAKKEAKKTSSATKPIDAKRTKRTPDALSDVDKAEADEEEAATLKEVKKRGYCYFNTKMDEKTQALYKNTTPQKINPSTASSAGPTGSTPALASQPRPLSTQGSTSSGGSGSFSDWNKAGTTWEEQDVSSRVQKELPDFLTGTSSTSGSSTSAKLVSINNCDGTASVACVRAKLRFFFDLSLKAKYSVELEDATVVTGTLDYTSMTALDMDDPDEEFEVTVKFDAGTPADKKKATRLQLKGLQVAVENRMKEYANSFLASF